MIRLRNALVASAVLAAGGLASIGIIAATSGASPSTTVITVLASGGSLPCGGCTAAIDTHGDLVVTDARTGNAFDQFGASQWGYWYNGNLSLSTQAGVAVTFTLVGQDQATVYFNDKSTPTVGLHGDLDITQSGNIVAEFAPNVWNYVTTDH